MYEYTLKVIQEHQEKIKQDMARFSQSKNIIPETLSRYMKADFQVFPFLIGSEITNHLRKIYCGYGQNIKHIYISDNVTLFGGILINDHYQNCNIDYFKLTCIDVKGIRYKQKYIINKQIFLVI